MTTEQTKAIVLLNAILCHKFRLPADTRHIVYHHWFDATGKRFPDNFVNAHLVYPGGTQKTCPGTAFFGGNRVMDATAHLTPLVQAALSDMHTVPKGATTLVKRTFATSLLNVRSGPGTQFSTVNTLPQQTLVNIVATVDGWARISITSDLWVRSSFLH